MSTTCETFKLDANTIGGSLGALLKVGAIAVSISSLANEHGIRRTAFVTIKAHELYWAEAHQAGSALALGQLDHILNELHVSPADRVVVFTKQFRTKPLAKRITKSGRLETEFFAEWFKSVAERLVYGEITMLAAQEILIDAGGIYEEMAWL